MIDETDDWRIVRFCREQLALPPVAFMDWRDVETLLRQGHEIGSHTMNHLDLGQLDNTRLQDEISRSYELLRERTGMARHFSWPYGRFRHFSPEAARTVFDAGFASCASAVRGCHVSGTAGRDLCVRRTHVVAGWPLRNVLFWLSYYGRTASPQSNCWPETWRAVLGETEGDAEPCGS